MFKIISEIANLQPNPGERKQLNVVSISITPFIKILINKKNCC